MKTITPEETTLRRDALANPGLAWTSEDGHTLVVSFDGVNCLIFRGPDFASMSNEEYQAWFDRENQTEE